MANSKAISIRIPDELLEKIDLLAEEKYKSHRGTPNRSLVVLDIIVAHFNTLSDTVKIEDAVSLSDSVDVSEFRQLQATVFTLSDSVKQLLAASKPIHSETTESVHNQLPIFSVPDSVTKPNTLNLDDGLTASQLGARLNETPQIVGSKKKNKSKEFADWSKERDPDSYGWEHKDDSKLYYPIKTLA